MSKNAVSPIKRKKLNPHHPEAKESEIVEAEESEIVEVENEATPEDPFLHLIRHHALVRIAAASVGAVAIDLVPIPDGICAHTWKAESDDSPLMACTQPTRSLFTHCETAFEKPVDIHVLPRLCDHCRQDLAKQEKAIQAQARGQETKRRKKAKAKAMQAKREQDGLVIRSKQNLDFNQL